jgi:hypothetical protein
VLLDWLKANYRPGELFSIYRIADQLDAWEPTDQARTWLREVSMPSWKLYEEASLEVRGRPAA